MSKNLITINAKRARRRVINGSTNRPMRVEGSIQILNDEKITHVSQHLRECQNLILSGCVNLVSLPDNLQVNELVISGCTSLKTLPENLSAKRIIANNTGLESIPESITVADELNLSNCVNLTALPDNLSVMFLNLSGCISLESLPDGLIVSHLDVSGCSNLISTGENGELTHPQEYERRSFRMQWNRDLFYPRTVNLSNCPMLTDFPEWITVINRLDLSNSPNLNQLPQHLHIVEVIELANSGLKFLPGSSAGVNILWNGVLINRDIAFRSDKISARMVLRENNQEVRRVMLERMGYRRFFDQLDPELLDLDEDAGGERMLLRVRQTGWWWEPIVCLAVSCPSTGHRYMLRVPPGMNNCHQAAAWLAGFDDPKLYKPLVEA